MSQTPGRSGARAEEAPPVPPRDGQHVIANLESYPGQYIAMERSGHDLPEYRPNVGNVPPNLDYRILGACNNIEFLRRYIGESPLTRLLKFAPLNTWPIVRPYNHPLLISMCTMYVEARYHYTDIDNIALKKAMVCGEVLSPMINITKYATEEEARASLPHYFRRAIMDDIFAVLGVYNDANYQMFKTENEVRIHFDINAMPAHYPLTVQERDNLNLDQSVFMMMFFATYINVAQRSLVIENVTLAYCSLAKRGTITEDFSTKIMNAMRDELGIPVRLTPPVVNALYKGYLGGVDEVIAERIFAWLDSLIPDIALRLKLTLQQASGSGLTLYVIIGRAMRKYYDFPWGRVDTLTGGELQAWNVARGIIGDNLYYGFKRDLGQARSTLYKSLGFVAKELLLRLNGEVTLRRYAGLAGNIKNREALNRLIHAYEANYQQEDIEQTIEEQNRIPNLAILQGIAMFA